jgi:serine/threonine-protein phosphatase 2B catalytic subunit
MYRNTPNKEIPSVTTLFSAPNYLNVHRNMAAMLKGEQRKFSLKPFHQRPHPYQLPRFIDAFSWSIPFICEKGEPASCHDVRCRLMVP